MAKGGARAGAGRPRDPQALRRDRDKPGQDGFVDLPAAGRDGPTPEWPLTKATIRETTLWEAEWRRPQALMWELNGQELEVALYVRAVRKAESPSAPVAAVSEVRRSMDNLGISATGMLRLKWRIVDSAATARTPVRKASQAGARDRLQLIQGG